MEIVNKGKVYKSEKTMVYSCQFHIVFVTKYRRRVLDEEIQEDLKSLILEKQEDYKYEVLEMEVMQDHVHLLLDVNPKIGVYNTIQKIKGYTSKILREKYDRLKSRIPSLWTRSRFISSVGTVSLETVKKYIEDQKNR